MFDKHISVFFTLWSSI